VLPEALRSGPGPATAQPPGSAVADRPRTASRLLGVLVGLTVLAGVVLRFLAPPALWLDEAQSVAIARADLADLVTGLRQDGAPPLYYLLLHGWTAAFGDGAVAVRSLSGLFSVLALPVGWAVARALAGPRVALGFLLLLASSPFAVRYGSETRMYSLVILLVLLGAGALLATVRRGGPWPVAGLAATSAALLLTHYWSAYLLTVVGVGALAGLRRHPGPARRVLVGLVIGGLAFLPWLPVFLDQLAHTGTPWAGTGDLTSLTTALDAWMGGGMLVAQLLGYALVVLAVLALVAVPEGRLVRLAVTGDHRPWALLAASFGTLALAGVVSWLTGTAVGARYSSVAFPAFLGLVAWGVAVLPGRRTRAALLAALVVSGLAVAGVQVDDRRTQAGDVAAALADAAPGDMVLFCPDQLGPAVSRLAPAGLDLVGYPDLRPVDRVDWTDYAERNDSADPEDVAARVAARAGDHAVWLVTGSRYSVPSDADCTRLGKTLAALRGEPELVVRRHARTYERMRMQVFGPPAQATP